MKTNYNDDDDDDFTVGYIKQHCFNFVYVLLCSRNGF